MPNKRRNADAPASNEALLQTATVSMLLDITILDALIDGDVITAKELSRRIGILSNSTQLSKEQRRAYRLIVEPILLHLKRRTNDG